MSDSQISDSSFTGDPVSDSVEYTTYRLHYFHLLHVNGLLLRLYRLQSALDLVNSVMRFLAFALIAFLVLVLGTPVADRAAFATPMSIALVVFAVSCLLQFSFRLYVYLEMRKITAVPLEGFQYLLLGFNLLLAAASLIAWWVLL